MSEVTILSLGDTLIVPIQVELHDRAARQMQCEIFEKLEVTGAGGLIIDLSAVGIVDSFLGRLLGETVRTATLMGTQTVLTGLKKEVVITLIQLGLIIRDIRTARTLEDGLELLARLRTGSDAVAEGTPL